MTDKKIRTLEKISALLSKNGEISDEIMLEVEQRIKEALTELSKKVNRIEKLKNSGVLEKAVELPKRGGTGRGKNKLVATTDEEKKILEQAREALLLYNETISVLEKVTELNKALRTLSENSPHVSPLAITFDGQLMHALARVRTTGKFDSMSRILKVEGVNMFLPEGALKIGVGAAKIFRYAVAEFTKHNRQGAKGKELQLRIFLDTNDYAAANGVDVNSVDAMKNFRRKVSKHLETLRTAGIRWTEKVKGHSESYSGENYISGYRIDSKHIKIVFSLEIAEYLTSLPLEQFSRALYSLDDRDFNTFAIGDAMCLHYSQDNNVIKGTEGKLRIMNLLKHTSLPTYEELKAHKWSWERYVREPFMDALDKLKQCGFLKDCQFCYDGGVEISDEDYEEIDSYEKFVSLIVDYELNDFEDSVTRKKKITEKKALQIEEAKAKRKTSKKADKNKAKE